MVDILDIAPAAETAVVRGQSVTVHGISATGVAHLLSRYPSLLDALAGKGFDVSVLLKSDDDVIGAVIAAGLGYPGDQAREKAASQLSLDDQVALFEAIAKATFPNGIAPFVQRLRALGVIARGAADESSKTSPKRSRS